MSVDAVTHFDTGAARYAATADSRPEFRERFAVFNRAIGRARDNVPPRALDLGCGAGHLTVQLGLAGFDTTAFDGSAHMTTTTQDRCRKAGVVADVRIQRLPLPRHVEQALPRQGLIVMSSVLEYLTDEGQMLAQCRRLLVDGGKMLASLPNADSVYWRLHDTAYYRPAPRRDAAYQRRRYTATAAEELARGHGFALDQLTYVCLPLQRFWSRHLRARPRRLATLMVLELTAV